MGYSRGILNYPDRIVVYDLNHMMSMTDPIAIDMKTLRTDGRCSLEKEFTKLIHMNP